MSTYPTPMTIGEKPAVAARARDVAEELAGLPRPTTGRIFVLMMALVGIGFAAGAQIHTSTQGDEWLAAAQSCVARFPAGLALGNSDGPALTGCLSGPERTHALYLAAGAVLIGVGALAYIAAIPAWIRRRRRLEAVGSRGRAAVDRLGRLAAEMGVKRPPLLMTGGPRQRDAFCFGRPGAPAIALPLKLIANPGSGRLFEPIAAHELAHIRHRDVALSWLARSFVLVAGLVAVLPIPIAAATADLSALPDYLWRAVLLVGVGWLVARAVLRTREFDADLAASLIVGPDALKTVLASSNVRPAAVGPRRLLDHHPSPASRIRILDRPDGVANAGVLSGLLPATLVFALLPALQTIASLALTGSATTIWLLPGVAAGSFMLAFSVGIDAVRAARVDGHTGRRQLRDLRICAGAGAGAVLGQVISPASAWLGFSAGVPVPALLFTGLLVCGATAVACGVARAVAERRFNWLTAVALTAFPWGFAIWLGLAIELTAPLGPDLVRQQLTYNGASWPAFVAAAIMIVLLVLTLGRRAAGAAMVGIAAAACGSTVMIAYHLLNLGPNTDLSIATFFVLGIDQSAIAAVVSAAVLAGLLGVRGAAEGGVAAAAASLAGTAAFVSFAAARGSTINGEVLASICAPMLTFPAAGWLALAPIGLVVVHRDRRPPVWFRVLVAGALTTTFVAIGSGLGPLLAPNPTSLVQGAADDPAPAQAPAAVDADEYRYLLAPKWMKEFNSLLATVDANAGGTADPAAAQRIVVLVQPDLATLQVDVDQIVGADPAVQSVHDELVTAVHDLSDYAELTIEFRRSNNPSARDRAQQARAQAADAYQRWVRGLATL